MRTRSFGVAVSLTVTLFATTALQDLRRVRADSAPSLAPATNPPGTPAARDTFTEMLPVAADGARTPERIPMDLAYRHLIRAIVGPDDDPLPDRVARRRAHLSRIGLSDADEASLLAVLHGVADELDRVQEAQRGAAMASLSGAPELSSLKVQERELLDTTRARFGSSLSANGIDRLDTYVREHVKKRIVIYGVMPQ